MELTVRDGAGSTVLLRLDAGVTVSGLKSHLAKRFGLAPALQCLALPLDQDCRSLASYGLAAGKSELRLSLALPCDSEAVAYDDPGPLREEHDEGCGKDIASATAAEEQGLCEAEQPLRIMVKEHRAGATVRAVPLEVRATDTVAAVKAMLQEREGLPREEHYLLLGGRALEDSASLGECDVSDSATLQLGFAVHVRGLQGARFAIRAAASERLGDLLAKAAAAEGRRATSRGQEHFYLAGQPLEGLERSLEECGVTGGCELDLRMAIRVETNRQAGALELHVKACQTVESVRQSLLGWYACRRLSYLGMDLDGQRTLASYGVVPGAQLSATRR